MNFFFRKKQVHLDCFTMDPFVFEYMKISPGVKYYPEWWKSLPTTFNPGDNILPVPTMKTCRGFTEYYKNIFILPSWGDIRIFVGSDKEKTFTYQTTFDRGPDKGITTHPPQQYNNWPSTPNFQHLKFNSPWRLRTKDDTLFYNGDVPWSRSNPTDYVTLPGITEYKYQFELNVNIIFDYRSQPRVIDIPVQTPVTSLIPLTDKDVVLHHHLVDSREWDNVSPYTRLLQTGGRGTVYNRRKTLLKEHEERNISKCPFHRNS